MSASPAGMFAEISFRRLLTSCTDIMNGDTKGRQDLRDWRTSVVFHHYVETLQEQLADLHASGKLDEDALHSYNQQVNAITDQLQQPAVPAYAAPPKAVSQPPRPSAGGAKPQVPPAAALPPSKISTVRAAEVPAPPPIQISAAARAKLNDHGRVHDALTDELAGMAASLKANTLAIEDRLKERGGLLEEAEVALDQSAAGTKRSLKDAKALRRRGRWNLCFTCLVMMSIGLGLVGMYMFIRVTRFTGYKAVSVPVMTPPVPGPMARMDGELEGMHEEL